MSLIHCPECGKEISDQADVCVGCGFPVGKKRSKRRSANTVTKEKINWFEKERHPLTLVATMASILLLVVCICFGVNGVIESMETTPTPTISPTAKPTPTTKPTAKPTAKPTPTPIPVYVKNGDILLRPPYERLCPLTVEVAGTNAYYVRLVYKSAPFSSYDDRELITVFGGIRDELSITADTDDIAFYVAPNSSVEIDVPVGEYKLYYCTGTTWYGKSKYFGEETSWYTSDDLLDFYTTSTAFNGHTLELYAQWNGNFETESIDEDEVPF